MSLYCPCYRKYIVEKIPTNSSYGKHLIARPMQIEVTIPFFFAFEVPCRASAADVPLKCKQPTATYLPLLTPPLSTVGWSKTTRFNNLWRKSAHTFYFFLIVSSQANITNTFFEQKSSRHPEVGVSQWHRQTNTQTNRWRLYDWICPEGQFSENLI